MLKNFKCDNLNLLQKKQQKQFLKENKDVLSRMRKKGIILKKKQHIEGIRKAGFLVVSTLNFIEKIIKPGISTNFINEVVHNFTIKNGAIPAPLNYRGYPKSVCVSVNQVICHGIPDKKILLEGDIVNVDVTSIVEGYYADASKSFFVGKVKNKAEHIVKVARNCLLIGLSLVKPGNTVVDIGAAIQKYAERNGCSIVREFVGHGIGLDFHESPQIPHYKYLSENFILVPNMIFTIEPMVNLGLRNVKILSDGWTVVTHDSSLSAQFEQTVCVTEKGYESLTPYVL